MGQSDWEKNEQANRDRAQQRLNMGQDPGGAYGDLRDKYAAQQAEQKRNSGGGGNNGCFPAGTKISTPRGEVKIEDIERGGIVYCFDVRSGSFQAKRVLRTKAHKMNQVIEVRFMDGSSLRTTKKHSFLSNGRWEKAEALKFGDKLSALAPDGALFEKEVSSVWVSEDIETVYNLVTKDCHNFVADGIVAHNFTFFRSLRVLFWRSWVALSDIDSQSDADLGKSALSQ